MRWIYHTSVRHRPGRGACAPARISHGGRHPLHLLWCIGLHFEFHPQSSQLVRCASHLVCIGEAVQVITPWRWHPTQALRDGLGKGRAFILLSSIIICSQPHYSNHCVPEECLLSEPQLSVPEDCRVDLVDTRMLWVGRLVNGRPF